jgi:hypothetical protein
VILFIYFLFLHLAEPLGSVRGTPRYRGTPVGNHWCIALSVADVNLQSGGVSEFITGTLCDYAVCSGKMYYQNL